MCAIILLVIAASAVAVSALWASDSPIVPDLLPVAAVGVSSAAESDRIEIENAGDPVAGPDTEQVLDAPEPFVFQKPLHDFCVEYGLSAYAAEPGEIPKTYSELHQKIQAKFNEAGLEVLSPHFRACRNGEAGGGVASDLAPAGE